MARGWRREELTPDARGSPMRGGALRVFQPMPPAVTGCPSVSPLSQGVVAILIKSLTFGLRPPDGRDSGDTQ